jgi:hypothetical protein
VRINEVELNPEVSDSGNEWLELYSEAEVNLADWTVLSSNGRNMSFNASFQGFFILNTSSNLLTNSNIKISLLNTNETIFETVNISDSYDDDRTWQYCYPDWVFTNSTKNQTNFCQVSQAASNTNNQDSNQQSPPNSENQTEEKEIELFLDYKSQINNGEEFEISLEAENIEKRNYDVKIFISIDEKVISESYDKKDEKWKSGRYYINDIQLENNREKTFQLRISKQYADFSGKARVYARVRKSSSPLYKEVSESIKINKIEETKEQKVEKTEGNAGKNERQPDVIRLGKDIKSYNSKTQYIKEYAIYFFIVFCIIVFVLLIIRWQKK